MHGKSIEHMCKRCLGMYQSSALLNCIHIPFLFSCAMPAVISRPIILMARLMAYEEEREHIYALGKQEGIERL